jgi:heterotetrameric sarcosine oxidase gamma subunit
MATGALRRTPLYEEHKTLGARLVDFAGWEMPVQYEGIKAEHEAVRKEAGLFDVSHMGEVVFRGPQAEEAVQRLVTRDVSRLAVGQAGYAAVCLPSGGTVDDVLVYRTPDDFLIVVNASNREKDVAHFEENVKDLDVEVVDDSDDWALLALQGPRAVELLQPFTQTELSPIKYYRYEVGEVEGAYAIISRTGYTGEDGFELFVRPDDAPLIWRKLIDAGAAPVGLGARIPCGSKRGCASMATSLMPRRRHWRQASASRYIWIRSRSSWGRRPCAGRRRRASRRGSSASRSRGAASPATTTRSRWVARRSGASPAGPCPRPWARPSGLRSWRRTWKMSSRW